MFSANTKSIWIREIDDSGDKLTTSDEHVYHHQLAPGCMIPASYVHQQTCQPSDSHLEDQTHILANQPALSCSNFVLALNPHFRIPHSLYFAALEGGAKWPSSVCANHGIPAALPWQQSWYLPLQLSDQSGKDANKSSRDGELLNSLTCKRYLVQFDHRHYENVDAKFLEDIKHKICYSLTTTLLMWQS